MAIPNIYNAASDKNTIQNSFPNLPKIITANLFLEPAMSIAQASLPKLIYD